MSKILNREVEKKQCLTKCSVCDAGFSDNDKKIFVKDPFGVSSKKHKIIRCAECCSWILNPRPAMSEMVAFYGEDFFAPIENKQEKSLLYNIALAHQEINFISEVEWVSSHIKNGGIYLDYSAGNGQLVKLVKRKRPDITIYATEFTEYTRKLISSYVLPKKCVKASLSEFKPGTKFDLISAFGVLEHVEDPKELLSAFCEHLAPGGKVLLSVPNPESCQALFFKQKWYNWLAPRHMTLIPMKTLKSILSLIGFNLIEEKHFFLRTNPTSFVVSLCPSLDPLKKLTHSKLLIFAILFYFFIPFELVFALFGRGGFMGVALESRDS